MKTREMIQRMRAQAAELTRIADEMEKDYFASVGGVSITPDAIKSVIKIKGMRPQHLAAHFNVPLSAITPIISLENGLKLNHRGWVQEVRTAEKI